MTLLACFFTPQRGLLVADTLTSARVFSDAHGDYHMRARAFVTKFTLLPHLGAVVGSTGRSMVGQDAEFGLNGGIDLPEGLRSVPELLPDWLNQWSTIHKARIWSQGHDPGDMRGNIWLLGYDAEAGRVRFWTFESEAEFEAQEREPGLYLSPGDDALVKGLGERPTSVDRERLLSVIQMQKRVADGALDDEDVTPIGGDVHGVEITAEGFTVKRLLTFHDKAQTAATFKDAAA